MNYIGSKLSLLTFLEESINKVVGKDKSCRVFCDIFAGTGAVGRHFKKQGYSVIANDLQFYSYVLNQQYIANHRTLLFEGLIDVIPGLSTSIPKERSSLVCNYLEQLKPREGFIYNNFCRGAKEEDYRLYFSDENGAKCDAIRQEIELWHKEQRLTKGEYYFLLATMIEAIDKVANTASVYGAFLKQIKTSARKPLQMTPAELILNDQEHAVYNCDANELIRNIEMDILYLDPPYNQRQYAANYHLLETIARYDSPTLFGKTGMRDYNKQKSRYSQRKEVVHAFKDLIDNAKAKYIFVSYNNEGLMSFEEIKSIMEQRGDYGCFECSHNRFQADKASPTRQIKASRTTEYLHYVVVKK